MPRPALLLCAALLTGAAAYGVGWLPGPDRAPDVLTPLAPAPSSVAPPSAPEATETPPPLPAAEAISPAPAPAVPALPVPKPQPLPAQAQIPEIRHEYQRLNNCGPVTIGMALSRWGSALNQYDIAPRLKPVRGDVNVSPDELAAYARSQGMDVHLARGGDRTLLRTLLAAGFPVIVETWFVTPDSGGMGHYRLLTGYDDRAMTFRALDSYLGPLKLAYGTFDELWRSFGRLYLVVAPPAKAPVLRRLLGTRADRPAAKQAWLRATEAEAAHRGDAVAFLNLGQARLDLGDARGAARAFDQAFAANPDPGLDPTRPGWVQGGLPWRTLWYTFGPLEAWVRAGRPADTLRLSAAVLRSAPAHEEAHYWRGRALAGLGRPSEARAAYQEALRLRPGFLTARLALSTLEAPGKVRSP
ncbi:C39 family peptidase [Deinococcus navajonensis]|uniref:Tetratricopeptide repeat protein n=1 Tax=Deinococcus navajonensis TaxID=309884 RepID=A0ABV8XSB1_9DEIO